MLKCIYYETEARININREQGDDEPADAAPYCLRPDGAGITVECGGDPLKCPEALPEDAANR